MMAAVDMRRRGAGELREDASRHQNPIALLIAAYRSRSEVRGPMRNRLRAVWPHSRDVLDQRALEVHVENLAAIADSQHRFRRAECMCKDGLVGGVSIQVQGVCFGGFLCAIPG